MKTQTHSADLCPSRSPPTPQTGFSSLSIKPVLLCFLRNFSSSLQSQLDFMEGRGLHSCTSGRKEQKTRKNNNKKKKQRGDTTGIRRSPHCLGLHPLAKPGQRGNSQKTANFGWKSFFLRSAINDWQAASCLKKRCSYYTYMNVFQPHGLPRSRRWRLTFPQMPYLCSSIKGKQARKRRGFSTRIYEPANGYLNESVAFWYLKKNKQKTCVQLWRMQGGLLLLAISR